MSWKIWVSLFLVASILILIWEWIRNKNIIYSSLIPNLAKSAKGAPTTHTMGIYYLPETYFEIQVVSWLSLHIDDNDKLTSTQVVQQDFKIKTTTKADASTCFFLEYRNDPLANHEFKLKLNEELLLENVDLVLSSQTPEIFSALSVAPTEIADTAAGDSFLETTIDAPPPAKTIIKKVKKQFVIPAWKSTVEKGDEVHWPVVINPHDEGLSGDLQIVDIGFRLFTKIEQDDQNTTETSETDGTQYWPGLLFRPRINAVTSVFSKIKAQELQFDLEGMQLLSKDHLICVPIRSTPFVKRTHTLSITKGELVAHNISNPSSLQGFIGIPINIAKAIVSIPAQLVRIQIKQINDEKARLIAIKELEEVKEEEKFSQEKLLASEQARLKTEARLLELTNDSSLEIRRLEYVISQLKQNPTEPNTIEYPNTINNEKT